MNELRNTFDERCGWILRIFLPFRLLFFSTIFGEAWRSLKLKKAGETSTANAPNQGETWINPFRMLGTLASQGFSLFHGVPPTDPKNIGFVS